uniref:Uncharacterized protein n=1 Tax=Nelumbo nucifera TaxID=4432 RepID=A0A822XI80_NELNU|nr:TPA_asm: hypothetical protein HUJ06_019968 [Nelumbo nucifera]
MCCNHILHLAFFIQQMPCPCQDHPCKVHHIQWFLLFLLLRRYGKQGQSISCELVGVEWVQGMGSHSMSGTPPFNQDAQVEASVSSSSMPYPNYMGSCFMHKWRSHETPCNFLQRDRSCARQEPEIGWLTYLMLQTIALAMK